MLHKFVISKNLIIFVHIVAYSLLIFGRFPSSIREIILIISKELILCISSIRLRLSIICNQSIRNVPWRKHLIHFGLAQLLIQMVYILLFWLHWRRSSLFPITIHHIALKRHAAVVSNWCSLLLLIRLTRLIRRLLVRSRILI